MGRSIWVALCVCGLLVGCAKKKNESTTWDHDPTVPIVGDGLTSTPAPTPAPTKPIPGKPTPPPATTPAPIIETKYCKHDDNGPYGTGVKYSDAVTLTSGPNDGAGHNWGEGGGCINRSIRETWAALNNQAALVWVGVTKSEYSQSNPPGGVNLFYQVNYEVDNPFPEPTVNWEMEWAHTVKTGTMDEPTQIVIDYMKVSGTTYIQYWEGSIVLDYIEPGVTAYTGRDLLNATTQDASDAQGNVQLTLNVAKTATANWTAIGGENPPAPNK